MDSALLYRTPITPEEALVLNRFYPGAQTYRCPACNSEVIPHSEAVRQAPGITPGKAHFEHKTLPDGGCVY